MKRIVFDASALSAFFEDRHGAAKIEDLITQSLTGKREVFMATTSLGELERDVRGARGPDAARLVLAKIAQLPIRFVDVDREISLLAAELSYRHGIPYLPCFAAAVAKARKAILITNNDKLVVLDPEIRIGLISNEQSTF